MTPQTPPVSSRRSRPSVGRSTLLTLALVAGGVVVAPSAQARPDERAAAPQVQVTQVYATGTPTESGTDIRTSTVARNTSTTSRQPSRTGRLYLLGNGRSYGLGTITVPSLAPRASTTVRATKTAPLYIPAGTFAVRACLGKIGAEVCRTSKASVVIRPADLSASPASLAFGEVPVGESSQARRVTITNTGHARSGALRVQTPDNPAFTTSASTCADSLDPGDSCRVSVTYAPTTPGPAASDLIVTSSFGGNATTELTGTGLGAATLSISPSGVGFDDVLVGDTSDPVTFTVTNDGNLASGVPTVSLGGSEDFEVDTTTCTAALAPAATCTVEVVFTPAARGARAATLTVAASPGGSAAAELTGTGLQPATLTLDPDAAAFPATVLGDESSPVTFTLTNTGDVASGTPTVTLAGVDADQFSIVTNGCTAAVPAAGTCTVDVTFAPTASGSASASLDVSATPGGSDSSSLTGLGQTQPALAISETSYDFGFTDAPTEHTFTITNTGDATTGTPDVAIDGDAAFAITSNTCTAPLPGGATCTVGVTYTGSGQDEQTAQLSVTATPGGTVTADLTGSPQALTVAPTSFDFGGVLVGGSSAPTTFTLTNHRLTAVQIDGEGVTGPFPLDNSCFQAVLPAGGTCTFSAHFAPTSPGPVTGFLDYFAQGGFARVEVAGSGLTPAAFSLSPSTVDFGAYAPGDVGTQQLTITNTGTQASSNISFSITGTDAIQFYTDSTDCPTSLPGGASCTVTVGFAPFTLGDKTATFTVNGAPGGNATLVGLGAPAGVTLFPATHNYGAVPVGGAGFFTFRVVNTTNNGEDMNSASSGPPFPLELNQDFTCVLVISTIQPHRWCTMTLSFKPQSVGTFSTTLTAGGTTFNTQSQLSGTGVPARRSSPSVSAPGSMPTSVALRGGKVAVRRE